MKEHPGDPEWWLKERKRRSLANILLPYLTAAIFLAAVIYAVLKWLKIL